MEAKNRHQKTYKSLKSPIINTLKGRQVLSSLFSVFFTALLLLPNISLAQELRPRLLVDSAVYNFGTVHQGDKVSTTFKLKNAGNADLLIQRVVAACGCTTTSPGKEKLLPGEVTEITVTFDTAGFSGEKLKTVRVFSNDPDQPSAVLTIQGVVEPDVFVEPTRVLFPEIVRGEAVNGAAQEFTIKVRSGASAKLGIPQASSGNITVTELAGGSDTNKRIQVILNPELPPGEFRERVVIPLSRGSTSAINVPVVATVRGTLELRPISLSFGVLEGQVPLQKTAKLENLTTSPVAIESISSDNNAVTAVSRPTKGTGDARQLEIVVIVDPRKIVSDLRANITIKTSRKSEPAMVLGVYGIRPDSTSAQTEK